MPKKKTIARRRRRQKQRQLAVQNQVMAPINTIALQTRQYAKALSNPSAAHGQLPGIPTDLALPSHKWKSRVRGVMVTGTQGTCFATLRPELGITNEVWAASYSHPAVVDRDWTPIITTDATYARADVAEVNPATGSPHTGVVGLISDSPYGNAMFQEVVNGENISKRKFRLVAAGVKIRYMGQELKRGGSIILWRNQDNGGTAPADEDVMLRSHHCTRAPVDRGWHQVTYRPSSTDHYNYHGPNDMLSGGGLNAVYAAPAPIVAAKIAVYGAEPGMAFELEADFYYEALGPNLTLTSTPSDPIGMSAVVSATRTVQNTRQPAAEEKTMANAMVNHVRNNVTIPGALNTMAKIGQVASGMYAASQAAKAAAPAAGFLGSIGMDIAEAAPLLLL